MLLPLDSTAELTSDFLISASSPFATIPTPASSYGPVDVIQSGLLSPSTRPTRASSSMRGASKGSSFRTCMQLGELIYRAKLTLLSLDRVLPAIYILKSPCLWDMVSRVGTRAA